jgi:DNA repair protein RecO (recombination protein O)
MYLQTKGLVLRRVNYRESDLLLTLLTEAGKLTAVARGARGRGSKVVGPSQLLAYSSFTLFENRGRYSVDEAESVDLMVELRADIELLALSSYFAELLEALSDEDEANPELLRLGLNTFYALGRLKKPPAIVKPAFEFKLLALSGYEPLVDRCAVCGNEEPAGARFDISGGLLYCGKCVPAGSGCCMHLAPGVLMALRHVLYGDPKRLFSFSLEPEEMGVFGKASEEFLLSQLERSFPTLEFYKSLNRDLSSYNGAKRNE